MVNKCDSVVVSTLESKGLKSYFFCTHPLIFLKLISDTSEPLREPLIVLSYTGQVTTQAEYLLFLLCILHLVLDQTVRKCGCLLHSGIKARTFKKGLKASPSWLHMAITVCVWWQSALLVFTSNTLCKT